MTESTTPQQQADADALHAQRYETTRATAPALEDLLHTPVPLLDHGFVRVVDYMGGGESVVQAARVSHGRGTRSVSGDRGLVRCLMRLGRTTPFEMCEIKLHVKLPIFAARQWIRHRTAGCGFSGAWNRWTRRPRPAAARGSGIGSDAEKTADADPGGVSTADAVRGMPNADSDEMAVSGQLSLPRLFSQPSTPGPRIRPVLNGEIRFPNGFEISDSPFLTAPGAGVWRQA